MTKIQSVTVAASTYGTLPRVNGWIQSIWNNLEPDITPKVLVVDDGTPDIGAVKKRAAYCQKFNVQFLYNEKNLGIPATWNRIFREAQTDLVVCFNDDIRLLTPGWLSRLIYVFEQNEKIGGVGLPLVNEKGFPYDDPCWDGDVGRVGAAVGAAFAMRPDVLFQVENPDRSLGFWDDLLSFHEEVHCGFRLAELGYCSLMLPWPPCHHMGGATFQASPELVWRDPSPYLPMKEFLAYVRVLPWYIPQYEEAYSQNKVDRMSYSRAQFCKYWGILKGERMQDVPRQGIVDCFSEPQRKIHEQVVTPLPRREIKWLDRAGKERVSEI